MVIRSKFGVILMVGMQLIYSTLPFGVLGKEFLIFYLVFSHTSLHRRLCDKIWFWLDPWVDSQPHASCFLRIFHLSTLKQKWYLVSFPLKIGTLTFAELERS